MKIQTAIAPTSPDRWAWERYYTDTVEYLMAARAGERLLRPSEVAEAAKARTIAAYGKVTGQEEPPAWLAALGDPPSVEPAPQTAPQPPPGA